MKKVFTFLSGSLCYYIQPKIYLIIFLFCIGLTKTFGQTCTPISTLLCEQLQVNLPFSLSFNSGVAGSLLDKNGAGTGFTMADAYTGTRLSADGSPANTSVPGYQASQLTLSGGRLQIVTNKGIASLTNNNQINTLGVRVNSQGKLQVEVSLINPFNGTSFQQAGLWFGLNDKTFLKLVVTGNKVELRKEVNDVSSGTSGTSNPDQRMTGTISGLDTRTVRLRLIVDPATNTAEGFYSIDGGTYLNAGAAYSTPALSISGMGLTASTAYAGIFATHRNSSTPVTYSFDDFSILSPTTGGGNAPVFTSSSYNYSVADNVAIGTTVGTVSATDAEGDAITYSISAGNVNTVFSIDVNSGAIKVAKSSYSTQQLYTLTIMASDASGLSSTASATINVISSSDESLINIISWGTVASQPYNIYESQGKAVNGKLYTFGGFDSQKSCCTPTDRAYVFDPVANTWTPIASMPPMNGTAYGGVTHAGFATDGVDIYFAGGYTSNSTGTGQIFGTREVWKYIVAENRYVSLPNLPVTISAGQLEFLNGRLHHIGGTNSSRTTDLDHHYVLDLNNLNGGWTTLAPLPNARHHAGSAVYDGKIYFIGGQKGHDGSLITQKDVHQYNPASNSWNKMADLPVPEGATGLGHISSAVIITGKQIIVLGGETKHGTSTNMVSAYNPAINAWTSLSPLPANRFSGVTARLGTNLYYTGGSNSRTTYRGIPQASQVTINVSPIADAFVRDGSFAGTNYGMDTSIIIRGTTSTGNIRQAYLKFPLSGVADVVSAKLRIYGRNTENTTNITTSVYGVDNDSWTETAITWNNAPASLTNAIGTFSVNNQRNYYEVDVTNFVKEQFIKDKILSLLIKDAANQNRTLSFNSRENNLFPPELIITTSAKLASSNAQLFVENLDRFPSNNDFVASKIHIPWSRDKIVYNTNHDTLRVRLHNKGINPLTISSLNLSSSINWKIITLKGATYDPASMLPLIINPGTFADMQVRFIHPDSLTRIKIILDELSIISNDDKQPYKTVYLRGIWQREGEGSKEPRAQEMITAFGFKSRTGFTATDPDKGASWKPKGDEVISSYYVRADPSKPVTVRQMGAYHGCCNQTENLRWYPKGAPSTLTTVVHHIAEDAQRLLTRRSRSTTYTPSEGSFNPSGSFGFKVGGKDFTDTLLNPTRKIGIRVWKAIDTRGYIIPNAYIIANDYLGSEFTNYDYNDNMYYVTNIRPEFGPASVSTLVSTPSAVEFGEQLLQSTSTFNLNLQSLGQVYANGSQDPVITISSISIAGENSSEFTVSLPAKMQLNPQESTTLTVGFNPVSQGLKIADLLVYYNNSQSPLRVPLYGIARSSNTVVSVPYRINSGSSTNVTINGKTWVSDVPYAFDNLEPYTNSLLTQISATDEDVIYLREQSSNGDKKPFRYEMPIENGSYVVRLHFAEIYWGAPGTGLSGGPGSRVMSVQLENEQKLINLDVAGEVGSASAIIKNIPVTVTDGKLNINLSATANRPMVCAVEVYKFTEGTTTTSSPDNQFLLDQPGVITNGKTVVYPNPLHDKFTINFPSVYEGIIQLQLIDVSGRTYEIGRAQLISGGTTMDIDISHLNLKAGVYILRINSAKSSESIKLLIR